MLSNDVGNVFLLYQVKVGLHVLLQPVNGSHRIVSTLHRTAEPVGAGAGVVWCPVCAVHYMSVIYTFCAHCTLHAQKTCQLIL